MKKALTSYRGNMRTFLSLLAILLISGVAKAQLGTEVYVADFAIVDSKVRITNVMNVSNNEGYDNQPSFLPDGSGLLYASTRDGQTDVIKYEFETGEKTWLTSTEGGEYSPTIMPDEKYFSAINLKPDGEQLMWKYPIEGGEPEVIVPEAVIGYYTWYDAKTVYAFVLGNPATLVKFDIEKGSSEKIASNIGRSIHKIPKLNAVSFVDKSNPDEWMVRYYNPDLGTITTLVPTYPETEDMCWTPDGQIVMGKGNMVGLFDIDTRSWNKPISVFKQEGTISRIAVSPTGDKIAIVFQIADEGN